MSVTLPINSAFPDYTFQVELDGLTYGLRFLWNEYAARWIVSIYTSDDQPIVTGVPLVVDWPLFRRYADSRLPPGMLVAQDTTGARQDPGRDDLGSQCLLLYFSPEELLP